MSWLEVEKQQNHQHGKIVNPINFSGNIQEEKQDYDFDWTEMQKQKQTSLY